MTGLEDEYDPDDPVEEADDGAISEAMQYVPAVVVDIRVPVKKPFVLPVFAFRNGSLAMIEVRPVVKIPFMLGAICTVVGTK